MTKCCRLIAIISWKLDVVGIVITCYPICGIMNFVTFFAWSKKSIELFKYLKNDKSF